jgi:hypothetical protein
MLNSKDVAADVCVGVKAQLLSAGKPEQVKTTLLGNAPDPLETVKL